VRVGLADFRWPLDPALAEGRDETTLARALYSTPLQTDPVSGAVVPGLCSGWQSADGFRRWTFTCRSAPAIAAALRRVAHLPDAPANWIFAQADRINADARTLSIRLRVPWRRFPYALTVVGSAPRTIPGPFELVSGSKQRVVLRREGSTVEFQRVAPREAVREFRQGALDEAPVPIGDVGATAADPRIGTAVKKRTLLGLDVVVLPPIAHDLRIAYRDTAARGDYEELIPEAAGAGAFGFFGDEKGSPARYRHAVAAIRTLPRRQVAIDVPPMLRAGARILYGQWRDVGLGPKLVSGSAKPQASFMRLMSSYAQQEAIPAELVLRSGLEPREGLLQALGATRQQAELKRVDTALWASARAVPIAWVVDARLVSPRLQGWREDALGNVDYASVRAPASSASR
jgi:hypothetical protein